MRAIILTIHLTKNCNNKTDWKVGLRETEIPLVRSVTIGHFKLPTSLSSIKIKDFTVKHKNFIHNRNNLTKLYILQCHIKIEKYLYFKIFQTHFKNRESKISQETFLQAERHWGGEFKVTKTEQLTDSTSRYHK